MISLFDSPNAADPLNQKAGKHMLEDLEGFKKQVTKTLKGGTHDGITYPKFRR